MKTRVKKIVTLGLVLLFVVLFTFFLKNVRIAIVEWRTVDGMDLYYVDMIRGEDYDTIKRVDKTKETKSFVLIWKNPEEVSFQVIPLSTIGRERDTMFLGIDCEVHWEFISFNDLKW